MDISHTRCERKMRDLVATKLTRESLIEKKCPLFVFQIKFSKNWLIHIAHMTIPNFYQTKASISFLFYTSISFFHLFQKIASDLENTYKEILYISLIAIGKLQKRIQGSFT